MKKGVARVIIGIILVGIGLFGWYKTLLDSIPPTNSPPPWYGFHMFDLFPVIVVHSIIAGVGVWLLVSGVRAYRAS